MTGKKLLWLSFLQLLLFTVLKIWFFNYEIFASQGLQQVVVWALVGIVAAAIVRRFGIINYLEAIFLIIFWTVGDLFFDLIITSNFTGLRIFSTAAYWTGFFVMDMVIFLCHKKRHVSLRHEMHAKKHAAQPPKH